MYKFEPIAIVGLGAIVPGCNSYKQLWKATENGKILLSDLAIINPEIYSDFLHNKPGTYVNEKTWTLRGGFIEGFKETFDPHKFSADPVSLLELDQIYQWSLMAAYEAFSCIKGANEKIKKKTGVIIGNTVMPTQLFSEYAFSALMNPLLRTSTAQKSPDINPLNRFVSGTLATIVSNYMGLSGETFSIDAACASGAYSIKLACDSLHRRESDLMLAGSVNAVARPMLHIAFSVLGALSLSGQSRPFHRDADGILPSEGASFIALKRLSDAVNNQDKIFGIIRGIGLSNAGREGNFIAPSSSAEASCIIKAYEQADLDPHCIPYIECHATGTTIGDSVEIRSLKEIFGEKKELVLSSLKSNFGHMMSNAGIASVIRTLGCFESNHFPATPNAELLNEELKDTNYQILQNKKPWLSNRTAGINSFGLGGSNGHMIIESPKDSSLLKTATKYTKITDKKIAIVGIGIKSSFANNTNDFLNLLFDIEKQVDLKPSRLSKISINPKKAFIPPINLKYVQGQQLLLLPALEEALSYLKSLDKKNTGIYVGMGLDPETARYLINMNLNFFIKKFFNSNNNISASSLKEKISPPLNETNTVGSLSHLVANRISHVIDSNGPSFTVSCEEISGDMAMKAAIAAIQKEEITTAIIGAVDLSNELIHQMACQGVDGLENRDGADAAVILVAQELNYALANKSKIFATIECSQNISTNKPSLNFLDSFGDKIGYSHATTGLINIAAAVITTNSNIEMNYTNAYIDKFKNNNLKDQGLQIKNKNFLGKEQSWNIKAYFDDYNSQNILNDIFIFYFSSSSIEELIDKITNNEQSEYGQYRLAFVCKKNTYNKKKEEAITFLKKLPSTENWAHNDIVFNCKPRQGKLAFVFTGSASAYSGSVRDIVKHFPSLIQVCKNKQTILSDIPAHALNKTNKLLPAFEQTIITNILSQVHFEYLSTILNLSSDAAIGLSQGETEALYSFGVWEKASSLAEDIKKIDLYGNSLSGQYKLANKYWEKDNASQVHWKNYFLSAPVNKVRELLINIKNVYLLIAYTDSQCVIGGDKIACEELLKKLSGYTYEEFFYDLIFHCPIAKLFKIQLQKLYHRKANTRTDVIFYSNYFGRAYELNDKNILEAIVGQATSTIDFTKVVNQAWEDGIRYFIELGPKSSLSSAIQNILNNKTHLAIPLDIEGKNSYKQMLQATAYLWCLGISINLKNVTTSKEQFIEIINNSDNMELETRLPDIDLSSYKKEERTDNKLMEIEPDLSIIYGNIERLHYNYMQSQHETIQRYHDISLEISNRIKKKLFGY